MAIGFLVGIINGKPVSDPGHQNALMSRIYQTTHAATDPVDAFYEQCRPVFDAALGDDTAGFLKAFNDVCERFRDAPKDKKEFVCEGDEQEILLAGLAKLEKSTKQRNGFFFPHPN